MSIVDPRIQGTSAVAPSSHGSAGGRQADTPTPEIPRVSLPGHGDRALLSAAARAHLQLEAQAGLDEVGDPTRLAEDLVGSAKASVEIAAKAHTAAVFGAALLIR